jgi:hypothetical protein
MHAVSPMRGISYLPDGEHNMPDSCISFLKKKGVYSKFPRLQPDECMERQKLEEAGRQELERIER